MAPVTRNSPRFFYGYVIVPVTFLIAVILAGAYRTFGIFFQPMIEELGWTRAMTSGSFSLGSILSGIFAIPAGRMTDRLGPRAVMTICGLLFGLGFLLMSQVNSLWQLYLFQGMIIGIAMSAAAVPSEATIARWFVDLRGMMVGLFQAGAGVGIMIIIPIAGWLMSTYDWRTAYMILGIVVLIFMTLASQFLKRDPASMGQVPYEKKETATHGHRFEGGELSLGQAIRSRQFWILCVMSLSLTFAMQTTYVHIVPHAIELGAPPATAANALIIIGGAGIVGRLVSGFLYDRIGSKPGYIIGFALLALSFLWLSTAREVWMIYLFTAIFGLSYSALIVLRAPLVAELFGLGSLGAIIGTINLGGMIGGATGPIVTGYIRDIADSYQLAFLIPAALSLIGLILIFMLKPIGRKHNP